MGSKFAERPWLAIPAIEELAKYDQWVCWGNQCADVPMKAPYQPFGAPAITTKRSTWAPFSDCFAAVVTGDFAGVGFVLTPDDPFVGIDLDHCIDSDGNLSAFAEEVIEQLDSYTEISPSGTGLHIFCKADLGDFSGRKNEQIEVYAHSRYFTVTADLWT